MNTRSWSGLLAVWLVCTSVACSDGKKPGEPKMRGTVPSAGSVCGNDIREDGESCDGTDVGMETCVSQGFDTGSLGCNDTCTGFETASCIQNPVSECGDNIKDLGEACDGRDLAGQSCTLMGFAGGTLGCLTTCEGFDTTACTTEPAACGNNALDGTEICDGTDLAGITCETLGLGTGALSCKNDCTGYDTRECAGVGTTTCVGPTRYHENGLNTALVDGEPCNFAGDCLSGTCNSSFHCGDSTVTAAVHLGDLPLGAACDQASSCQSGYCWGGDDMWICAEVCAEGNDPASVEPGMNCVTIGADHMNPPSTGAACVPSGAGYIGDACETAAFDCRSRVCWNSEFCTEVCDPTDPESCVDGGTGVSACELVNTDPVSGANYACIPTTAGNTVAEGAECQFHYECLDGLNCLEGLCRQSCGENAPCPEGQYCAMDNPAGPICLAESARTAVGGACAATSECVEGAICYDAGEGGQCRLLCPNGATECADAGLAANCSDLPIGQSLDTLAKLYDSLDTTATFARDDDGGENFFSKVDQALEVGTKDYFIEITRYPNGPSGAYSLTVTLNGAAAGNVVVEDETTPNDTRASAQVITLGDRIDASFTNMGDVDDVDVFKVTVTAAEGDRLVIETGKAIAGICYEMATTLLENGATCQTSAECLNDCFPHVRVGDSFCASRCGSDEDCGGGQCVVFTDNGSSDGFCLPAGTIEVGAKAFGEECSGPHECGSLMCTMHPVEQTYRCGAACEQADFACAQDAGRCLAPEAIYNQACVAHLNGTVAAGSACRWTADCMAGNICEAGQCLPENVSSSRYQPAPVADGLPCNDDAECLSGKCNDKYFCGEGEGDAATCDGCLANGQPCNSAAECAGGACFSGDRAAWFCADSCEGEESTCEGELFGSTDLMCRADRRGTFACVPSPGVGAPADPCESGYLDCESGLCWDRAFCIAACGLTDGDCGREADCVVYETTPEPERQLDTELSVMNEMGDILAQNDNIMYDTSIASFYSSVNYTNTSEDATYVWLRVQSGFHSGQFFGKYQLQVYTTDDPPPFGNPIQESELRENPVENDTLVLAHDLMAIGYPARVMGELSENTVDVDYFRVELLAGQTLTVSTAAPIGFVCWPSDELETATGSECKFDFECGSGVCLGTCAEECTGGQECEAGFECDSFVEDSRAYCFKSLKFGESCEGASKSEVVSWDYPACPNNACFLRAEGEPMWCSAPCDTQLRGAGCGNLEGETYDGECFERADGFFCVPHLQGAMEEGATCLLNADCGTGCCDTTINQCGVDSCYGQ